MAPAKVKSVATRRFWDLFYALPRDIQELALKNYGLWRADPYHPSLHFHKLQGSADRFSVRIGSHQVAGTLGAPRRQSARSPNQSRRVGH